VLDGFDAERDAEMAFADAGRTGHILPGINRSQSSFTTACIPCGANVWTLSVSTTMPNAS
jgi:hypothetical protein